MNTENNFNQSSFNTQDNNVTLNNQTINNIKPPKKSKLGLVIGGIATLSIAAAAGAFLMMNNDNQSTNTNDNNSNNKPSINENINLTEKYDNIKYANYVDSYYSLYLEYPVYIEYQKADYHSNDTFTVSNLDYGTNFYSALGKQTFMIYYPSLDNSVGKYEDTYNTGKEFYDNYFKNLEEKKFRLAYNDCRSECKITGEKHIKSHNINSLTWEEYHITFSNGDSTKIFITVKNNEPIVLVFKLVAENPFKDRPYNTMTDDEWKYIRENRDSIILSIVNSLKFSDDKQELLNKKEISVLRSNISSAYYEIITAYESQLYDTSLIPKPISNSILNYYDGISIKNTKNISIDEVFNAINTQVPLSNGVLINFGTAAMRGSDATVTVNETEKSYKISNNYIGEYEVKYYDLTITSATGGMDHAGAYVFKTTDTYGFILQTYSPNDNKRNFKNSMDYVIKHINFKTTNNNTYKWNIKDF